MILRPTNTCAIPLQVQLNDQVKSRVVIRPTGAGPKWAARHTSAMLKGMDSSDTPKPHARAPPAQDAVSNWLVHDHQSGDSCALFIGYDVPDPGRRPRCPMAIRSDGDHPVDLPT